MVLREAHLQAEKLLEEKRQEQNQISTEILALKQLKRQAAEQLRSELEMLRRLVEQKLVDTT
jgi:hypothetical protein